jgi:regulator of sigma E protease
VMFDIERSGETRRIGVPVSGRSGLDNFGDVIDIGWAGIGHRRLPSLLGIGSSGTEASRVGLLSGDRVVRVAGEGDAGGREVEDWRQLRDAYAAAAAEGQGETVFRVARLVEEETEEIDVTVPVLADLTALGVMPAAILVRRVSEGMPADEVGLEPGDLILGVDGEPVGSFDTFAEIVRSSEGRSFLLSYSRKGVPHEVEIAARESVIPSPLQIEGMEQKGYLIGVSPAIATLPGASHIEKVLNPFVSIPRAFMMTVEVSIHFLKGMKKLVSGNVSLDNVAGPIGIAEIARKSLDLGWMTYLSTLILISINLGFLNLLPIPILDGGQALIYAVEGIKRSPISMRSREIVQQIGLTMIMMLMGLAFWNDLSRHWSQFLEWLGAGL